MNIITLIYAAVKAAVTKILILLVNLYKIFISPMLGPSCIYHPSCSTYSIEALKMHGPVKGLALTAYRVVRCNPLCKGGHDPVPTEFSFFK